MINDNNGNMITMIIIIIDTGLHSDMGGIGWLAKQPHLTWQPRRLQPSCWSSEKPCWVRTNGSIPTAGWFIELKIPSINGWFGSNPIFLGHLRKKKKKNCGSFHWSFCWRTNSEKNGPGTESFAVPSGEDVRAGQGAAKIWDAPARTFSGNFTQLATDNGWKSYGLIFRWFTYIYLLYDWTYLKHFNVKLPEAKYVVRSESFCGDLQRFMLCLVAVVLPRKWCVKTAVEWNLSTKHQTWGSQRWSWWSSFARLKLPSFGD